MNNKQITGTDMITIYAFDLSERAIFFLNKKAIIRKTTNILDTNINII